jgi:hypothetical protein
MNARSARQFDLVWLSTDAQVGALTEAYRRATLVTKLLGRFDLPQDAAYVRSFLMPWARLPLVFVAQGRLTVDERTIAFTPRTHRIFGWRMFGVRSDLQFAYSASELVAVEPADVQSPFAHYFDIPFTRIRTAHAPPLDNFLLCVGGRFSMPRIRKQSLELRHELLSLVARPIV